MVIAAFFGGSMGDIKGFKDIFAPKFLIAAGLMVIILAVPAIYGILRRRLYR